MNKYLLLILFFGNVVSHAQHICREQFSFSTDYVFYDAIHSDGNILLCGNKVINGSNASAVVGKYECDSIPIIYENKKSHGLSTTPFFRISNTTYFGEIEYNDSLSILSILQYDTDKITRINSDTLPAADLNIREIHSLLGYIFLVGECNNANSSNYTDIILLRLDPTSMAINRFKIYPQAGPQFGTSIIEIDNSSIAISGIFYEDLNDTLPYSSYTNSLLIVDTLLKLKDVRYLAGNIWNNTSLVSVNQEPYVAGMDRVYDTVSLRSYDEIVLAKILAFSDPVSVKKTSIKSFSDYTISALHPVDYMDNSFFLGGTNKFDSTTSNYIEITGFGTIDNDYVIAKFDTSLTQQWVRFYGVPDAYEFLWKVLALDDGGCLLIGTTYDYVNATEQKRDLYIVRLDSNGNTFNTATPPDVLADNAYRLYPNPATDQLTLRLPNSAYGHLQLMNMNGQSVWQGRVEDYQTIPIAHLPPGLYLYHLTDAEQRTATGKVVVQ